MCVAVPFRVRSIAGRIAALESQGVLAEADVSLLTDVQPGDYILVHAGFGLTKLDPDEAEKTLAVFAEIAGEPL